MLESHDWDKSDLILKMFLVAMELDKEVISLDVKWIDPESHQRSVTFKWLNWVKIEFCGWILTVKTVF
jgi:hypothetical protein